MYNIKNLKTDLDKKGEAHWNKIGERMALRIFRQASERVPAYRDFLKANKINPRMIKTVADFSNVPPINKKNYLLKYPLERLCWDGKIEKADMISLSSGSSGKPFYWLRSEQQEEEATLNHELFMRDSFEIDKHSTLFIVSFAMGMWVAGTLTYRAGQALAEKYGMTVITPGINKQDILNIVNELGNKYEQIIIAGYPPFVKDIIDEGERQNINWKKHKMKFLFAAESFSEEWRDYIYKKVGAKSPLKDSLNIYGTADALILAHETPLSILIRRLADSDNSGLYKDIFNYDERAPSLVQYNPGWRYFEAVNNNLLFTSFSGVPLVRYDIGDSGNIIKYSEMETCLKRHGVEINNKASSLKISNWKLPFLYVYGRDDFTASLYGINIYPENIRNALGRRGIDKDVSGKFVMFTKNDTKMNQYLGIVAELKDGIRKVDAGLANKVKLAVTETLKQKNNEYNELYKSIGSAAEPRIRLSQYGHKDFFAPGVKQKWYKKNVV